MPDVLKCPTCKRPYPNQGRICSRCERRMGSHDKWHFVGSTVEHKDCEDPQLSKQAEQLRRDRSAQSNLMPEVHDASV